MDAGRTHGSSFTLFLGRDKITLNYEPCSMFVMDRCVAVANTGCRGFVCYSEIQLSLPPPLCCCVVGVGDRSLFVMSESHYL